MEEDNSGFDKDDPEPGVVRGVGERDRGVSFEDSPLSECTDVDEDVEEAEDNSGRYRLSNGSCLVLGGGKMPPCSIFQR